MPEQLPLSCRKILLCITEDWFCLSHFQPLLRTLIGLGSEVVVATRSSGRLGEIEALGCRTIPFDFRRSSLDPVSQAGVVRRLAALIAKERPDVVHAIAMQTLIVTGLAAKLAPVPRLMLHLTGLGFVGISSSRAARLVRPLALRILSGVVGRPGRWLIAENPDDIAYLVEGGADPGLRVTIVGGAGIDPREWPAQPMPVNEVPVAAFVGRMIRSKGVDVLVEARRRLVARGGRLEIDLYGKTDVDNPEGVPQAELDAWARAGGVRLNGFVSDVHGVWRRADIAVLPAVTREGMPRAVLEAAASARPLVVTDVPGCRHFVRDGREGFVVPPADAQALADALGRLAGDRELRARMGAAARERVLSGFTVEHVTAGVQQAYRELLST